MSSAIIQEIQSILSQQARVDKPPAHVCTAIANLKDLCELQSSAQLDWRRGTGGNGGYQNGRTGGPSGSAGGGRPMFKNVSSGSLASGSSSGRSSPFSSPRPQGPSGPSMLPSNGHHHHHVRYQSRFKNSNQPVEDKILNNIILSQLNKFSANTYEDIREFLYQILGSGEPDLADMIRHFMLLVFKKAAAEEVFCPLYAKLLAEISSRYRVILEEMKRLQANYLEIFDDVEEVPEGGEAYDDYVKKKKERMYRQGYSQFLAELAGLEILELPLLEQTFQKLFALMKRHAAEKEKKALIEEYADCLVRMSRVLKGRTSAFVSEARAALWKCSKDTLEELLAKKENYPSLSPKARFILMDVKDNLSIQ